jgi:altered-inheritance-of-mitochondria protein 5
MGFTTGFTGGVVLTLGVTYLALRAHQQNRETQSEIIRAQTALLDSTMPRATRRRFMTEQEHQRQLQQTLAESGRRREPHLVETAKERWNREIESFAHWLQHADWVSTREAIEENVSRTFTELGGDEKVAQGKEKVADAAHSVGGEAKEKSGWLWAKAEETKEKAKEAEKKAEDKTKEAAESLAGHAKESSWSLFGKARETVSSAVDSTSSAAGVAADKASGETPVQKALRERYEHPSGLDKPVAQALEERYTSSDKRGHTGLR